MENTLADFFAPFRQNIIGQDQRFDSPFGQQKLLYADWTASGRAYGPIEACLQTQVMPFLANTHTETTLTGSLMSHAYETARQIIKQHVHADTEDRLLFCGSGMTAAVTKLQRILGLRLPERIVDYLSKTAHSDTGRSIVESYLTIDEALRPVVFISHMEHHSNQISWLETIATVEIIPPDKQGNVDLASFRTLLNQYRDRKTKIAAITACSNVTGIQTPYQAIARLIHAYGGYCFVDFACSAPYVTIDMHPAEEGAHLDAIYFSPHKFLGGPGAAGVLVFNRKLYKNPVPDQPGGGTVVYSNPWQVHAYTTDIEQREDGGTPPILQGIKAAMAVRLKEAMGVDNMLKREKELLHRAFERLATIPKIHVLEGQQKERLGIISFLVEGVHYQLAVKLLNDRFGIQTRGGCSCAGTYGHWLLQVDQKRSAQLLALIQAGDMWSKPGWVRLSLHPTMTDAELTYILDALEWMATHTQEWMGYYSYDATTNQYSINGATTQPQRLVEEWFQPAHWDGV